MTLHRPSGRWRLGLGLALATACMWATLPVALKLTLERLDPYTLTWSRFVAAFVLTGGWLLARRRTGEFRSLSRGDRWLLAIAASTLIGNYVLYVMGLQRTTPANAQVIIQLAPISMAVGGIVVFRERFSGRQWIGFGVVLAGLALFFHDQLSAAVGETPRYVTGSLLVALAGLVWAAYALAQKQLLRKLSSASILLFIYGTASVVLLPVAEPAALLRLDALHLAALAYCALNTLAAYGAFAEALAHWEASRVSVVLAVTPLLTMLTATAAHLWFPDRFAATHIELLGYAGALGVVAGSALTSLKRARPSDAAAAS